MARYEDVKICLEEAGQAHLLHFWAELDEREKCSFLEHLNSIDYVEMNEIFHKAQNSLNEDAKKVDDLMKPIAESQVGSEERSSRETLDEYRRIGLQEIANGRVGVLLLAGGQGTRLGVAYPKGMYSIGLPSEKTLFQVQAERIRKVQELAKRQTGQNGRITWYIMTSGPTEEATLEYLKKNDYFGLDPKDVVQFGQGLLPCFDMQGRIFLDDKTRLALAPDGNGGTYRALQQNGVLDDMERRGVRYIHVHSVDNILVKVADPVFVGYCVSKGADCGAKVVRKTNPHEAVGVVCQVDGLVKVVEYSEITDHTANLRDSRGELVFNAGNICNHFFSTSFLREVGLKHEKHLKLHVAKKKIPHIDESGARVKPTSVNGIKVEKFVFDVFQFSSKFVTWEVPRYTEFSALKNADDAEKDCPSTARRDLFNLHKRYIDAAGGKVNGDVVEISPLLSYAGEDLEDVVAGKKFQSPLLLSEDEIRKPGSGDINGHA